MKQLSLNCGQYLGLGLCPKRWAANKNLWKPWRSRWRRSRWRSVSICGAGAWSQAERDDLAKSGTQGLESVGLWWMQDARRSSQDTEKELKIWVNKDSLESLVNDEHLGWNTMSSAKYNVGIVKPNIFQGFPIAGNHLSSPSQNI